MGNEPFQSLEAFIYQPHEHNFATREWMLVIDLPEGPELGHDGQAGHFNVRARDFAQLMRRTQLLVDLMNYEGDLVLMVRAPHASRQIGSIDYTGLEPDITLDPAALEEAFGFDARAASRMNLDPNFDVADAWDRKPAPSADLDDAGKCVCCGDEPCHDPSDPPITAREANEEDRKQRQREHNARAEQRRYLDTELSVNPYNTETETYTFARFEQSKGTLLKMAEWLEEQGGLTTHLAGLIALNLHGDLTDPGTTYSHIAEVGWRPKDDVAVIEVADAEEDMDLIIEVRQAHKD